MRSLAERLAGPRGAAWSALAAALVLAGCASGPKGGEGRSGRDGPGANPPSNLSSVPDAEPRIESIRSSGGTSKPYTVLGRSYVPITDDRPLRESGVASWYGNKFHGQSTASGEPYDMYAMTAAHKTLPLPSYVRVRNPANGREVVVRVNDRGPFHDGRIIDLSYTAALKLDLLRGVGPVEIERITNEDIRTGAWRRGVGETMLASAAAPPPPPPPPPRAVAPAPVAVPAAWTANAAAAPADSVALPAQPSAAPAPSAMVVTELPPLTPAAAPTPSPLPSSSSSNAEAPSAGFWLQLGAFRERDGAEGLRSRAARGLPALASQLRVFSEDGTHRLQAGPFATRDAAAATVSQVREELRIAPIVVERR